MNSSDKRTVALVMLNYAIALPPICVAVYQYPSTVPIILLTPYHNAPTPLRSVFSM